MKWYIQLGGTVLIVVVGVGIHSWIISESNTGSYICGLLVGAVLGIWNLRFGVKNENGR